MKPFRRLEAIVLPLDRANVDTDAIIPKQYLKSIRRSGFGVTLFDDWRYLDPGEPDGDHRARRLNPDFILNNARYRGAQILLARKNFGCGSSREHAVWALDDYGFRVVIAPSFADIFYNNCFKNGLLPIALPESTLDQLFSECFGKAGYSLEIDLESQQVRSPSGAQFSFEIDPYRKHCLLEGLDEIALTLKHADDIRAFEALRKKNAPWLF